MADAANTPVEETSEELDNPEASSGSDTSSPAAKWGKLIGIPLLLLLPLGGGGYLAYSQYETIEQTVTQAQSIVNRYWGGGSEDRYGQFLEIENLIVNPTGTSGQRYLMVTAALEGPGSAIQEVETKEVVIRDTMLKVLAQHTVDELASLSNRNRTKRKLRKAVNGVLADDGIKRLYFTQYVLQ